MMAEGVPEIAPVDESKDKPAGREGETDHDTTVPPLEVGVTVVMRLSLVNESEFGV